MHKGWMRCGGGCLCSKVGDITRRVSLWWDALGRQTVSDELELFVDARITGLAPSNGIYDAQMRWANP